MNASRTGRRPLAVAALVTTAVVLVAYLGPEAYASTLVGAVFFLASYALVLRHDAATIEHHGMSFGGLFEPEPLSARRVAKSLGRAAAWCGLLCLLTFPPFLIGYRLWFSPHHELTFAPGAHPFDEVLGQLFAVALPEEMFYRGYLQTALDDAWRPRVKILGAELGMGLIVSSAIFALGHVLTTPNAARLSVFFPALLFGWLRARTGGIGSAVLYHAACNLFSAYLARGYGFTV